MSRLHLFRNTFKNKKVFITGHTGFKGSWLGLWLLQLGAEVTGYSLRPDTKPNLFDQTKLSAHLASYIGDVRNSANLEKILKKAKPDVVFHLAAQPLVRKSYRDPVETFSTNLMGTVNLLEAVKKLDSVRVCQIITSDKCYDIQKSRSPYIESDPLGGKDPYSASKACVELIAASYRNSFFAQSQTSLSTVRAGNVIGGGDWSENRILPDCIRALSKGKPIEVRNPTSVRPWQHVLDCLSGYLMLAEHQLRSPADFAEAFNFGPNPNERLKVSEIVELVIKNWGEGKWIKAGSEKSKKASYFETAELELNCAKSKSRLNWRPVYHVRESIEKTAEWYWRMFHSSKFNAFQFSNEQIRSFSETAKERKLNWAK